MRQNYINSNGFMRPVIYRASLSMLLISASVIVSLPALAQSNDILREQEKSPRASQSLKADSSKSRKGESVFILNNGMVIPQTNSDGQQGKALANGHVLFPKSVRIVPQGTYGTDIKKNGKFVKRLTPRQAITKVDLAGIVVLPSTPRDQRAPSQSGRSSGKQAPANSSSGLESVRSPQIYSRPDTGNGSSSPSGTGGGASLPVGNVTSPSSSPTITNTAPPNDASGGGSTTLSNGQRVGLDNNGSPGVVNDDGSVTYGNGRSVHVDPETGDTVAVNADGSEHSRTSAPGVAFLTKDENGNPVFQMGNGTITPRTDQSGGTGQPNNNGGVDYPDGTTTSVTPNGRSVIHSPGKGTYITITTGTDDNGNEVFDLGNGTSVPAEGRGGSGQIGRGGSAVIYPDGTEVMVDGKTGNTVFIYSDGSSSARTPGNQEEAEAYVSVVDGDGSGSNDNNSSNDSSSDDSSSDDSSSDDSSSDDGSSDDSSSDDSSNDDSSSDDGSDSSSSNDSGDNSGSDDSGSDEMRMGGNSTRGQHDAKTLVDDFVGRKKGEGRDVEGVTPPPCDEDGENPAMEPEATGTQNGCAPTIKDSGEEEPAKAPDAADNIPTMPVPASGQSITVQPGIESDVDRLNNDGRSFDDKLEDIEAITNPNR